MRTVTMAFLLLMISISPALADWSDDFESYTPGSGLIGQGGWEGWLGNTTDDATVTDLYAHGGTNSIEVEQPADVLQLFEGVNSGVWEIVAWSYVPTGFTGVLSFIVEYYYEAYGESNCYLEFRGSTGQVVDVQGGNTASIVYDEWVPVHVVADLSLGTYTSYYNDAALRTGFHSSQIVALELYASDSSATYWDDISLFYSSVAVESTSLSSIKALY